MTIPAWHEEPIAKHHDRKAFDCGDAAMNEFLHRYARQSHDAGGAKTFLAINNADNTTVLGFYSLAPGALAYADTPEMVRRGLARHDVPGFRLAHLATQLQLQGQGLGRQLHRCEERPRRKLVCCLRRRAVSQYAAHACHVPGDICNRIESHRPAITQVRTMM